MTQNWVGQVVSSLVSTENEHFGTVCHRTLFMENWFNSEKII